MRPDALLGCMLQNGPNCCPRKAHLKAFQPMAAERACRQAVRSLTMASVRTGAPLKLADALMAASLISIAAQASVRYMTGSVRSDSSSAQVRRMNATL